MDNRSYHECPVDGCIVALPYDKLLCRYHWGMVPKFLQSVVYDAWNNGKPNRDYLAVRQVAIEAVNRGLKARD